MRGWGSSVLSARWLERSRLTGKHRDGDLVVLYHHLRKCWGECAQGDWPKAFTFSGPDLVHSGFFSTANRNE